jgi:adenine specific DNA methylase Mod
MYLHCDWHAGHRLQVLMDKIFHENLVNESIWKRTSAHTGEGKVRSFGTVHDVILFYSKSNNYTFIPQYVPLNKDYVERFYRNVDKDGRRYTSSDLAARGVRHGESGKPWHGIDPSKLGNHWKTTISKLDELEKQDRIIFPKKTGGIPRYKRYLDEMKGQLLQDVWTDILPVQAHSKERLSYPTQKPEQLLERIITVSSARAKLAISVLMVG